MPKVKIQMLETVEDMNAWPMPEGGNLDTLKEPFGGELIVKGGLVYRNDTLIGGRQYALEQSQADNLIKIKKARAL